MILKGRSGVGCAGRRITATVAFFIESEMSRVFTV
jgi:hypothetical protein